MHATDVDWSMGSAAARLADWDTALQLGRRVAGPGISVPAVQRARMREDFAELVPHGRTLITAAHRHERRGVPVARVGHGAQRMDPREPQRACNDCSSRSPSGCSPRSRAAPRSRRKAHGRAGRRAVRLRRRGACSASTTCSCRPTTKGCSTSSGRTSPRWSAGSRCRPATSGCGSRSTRSPTGCSSAPLRGCGPTCAGWSTPTWAACRSTAGSSSRSCAAPWTRRARAPTRAWGASSCCSPPSSASSSPGCRALMSLLEGHASYVMNEVAREHVADVDRMRRALAERRKGSGVERSVQKAIGFEQKVQQYDRGERVRARGDRAGRHGRLQPGLAARPSTCPRSTRSATPAAWVERVAG